MNRVTKEQVAKAKEMDLLTYLKNYEPNNLIRKGNDYCTKEHDSLSISTNGLWNWCSRGIGGKTALQYLIKVKDMSFVDAVIHLTENSMTTEIPLQEVIKKRKDFVLPERFYNNNRVIDYLKNRGISDEVILYCIDNNLIYESKKYHNAVFVGYDENKTPRYGALRGTWASNKTPFKGEVESSDKRYSFKIVADSKKLIVAESAIDVLSIATLRGKLDCSYLSVGGIYKPKSVNSNAKLPIALTSFLHSNSHVKNIVLCLDNDDIGRGASVYIGRKLALDGYNVSSRPTQKVKDYNDLIVHKKSHSYNER